MYNIDNQTDQDVLEWIYCRLRNIHQYGWANKFMVRLRKVAAKQLLTDNDVEKLIKLANKDSKLCNKLKSIRYNR